MSSEYALGESTYRSVPRFETKPEGYERIRSYEITPGLEEWRGKRDVYVYVHRLHALLHPDVVDLPIERALEALDGCDVHHKNGVKWDNRIGNYEILEHGRHSSITQQELAGLAKDKKRELEREEEEYAKQQVGIGVCPGCRTETETLATSPGFEGERCLDCAMKEAEGATINI